PADPPWFHCHIPDTAPMPACSPHVPDPLLRETIAPPWLHRFLSPDREDTWPQGCSSQPAHRTDRLHNSVGKPSRRPSPPPDLWHNIPTTCPLLRAHRGPRQTPAVARHAARSAPP